MPGPGIAVEELDGLPGRRLHNGFVDGFVDRNRSHRLAAVRQRLRHRHDVGLHVEALCRERPSGSSESTDDFIEYEQYPVPVAYLPQALQVAGRRHETAGGAGDGLDETRGNGVRAVHRDDAFEIVGQVGAAVRRLSAGETVPFEPRVPHVRDPGHPDPERLAVLHHSAQARPADVDAVVGPLARDHAHPGSLAPRTVIGQRDLDRGVDRFGAGVDEEHPVQPLRGEPGDPAGELELARMPGLKRRAVIEAQELVVNRLCDLVAAVPARRTEQPGRSIEHLPAVMVDEEDAVAFDDQARIGLEIPIRGERHPVILERVGGWSHGNTSMIGGGFRRGGLSPARVP